jgi:hypothetical protein
VEHIDPIFEVKEAKQDTSVKQVALYSSEMLIDFQRTTRRSIPEDSTLHNKCCEYLKSYKKLDCPIK